MNRMFSLTLLGALTTLAGAVELPERYRGVPLSGFFPEVPRTEIVDKPIPVPIATPTKPWHLDYRVTMVFQEQKREGILVGIRNIRDRRNHLLRPGSEVGGLELQAVQHDEAGTRVTISQAGTPHVIEFGRRVATPSAKPALTPKPRPRLPVIRR